MRERGCAILLGAMGMCIAKSQDEFSLSAVLNISFMSKRGISTDRSYPAGMEARRSELVSQNQSLIKAHLVGLTNLPSGTA
jgi:hypothetical protein